MEKRIVVIAEYFPPRLGADRRIFELMKRLSHKHDIHFITLPPSYTLFIRKIDTYNKNEQEISCEGMRSHRIVLPKLIQKLWTKNLLIVFMITEIYLCLKMLKKMALLKPSIVIIDHTSVYTGLLGFICCKFMNKKLLVDYNDLMALYTFDLLKDRINPRLQNIVRRTLVLIEDILVKYGWKVTTITVFIRNYARTRNIKREIIIIPNGVDTVLFNPAKADGKKVRLKYNIEDGRKLCVYAGRIDDVAGTEIILETAKLLKNEGKIKFMLVGEGNLEILKKFSNYDNVILTGLVSKESVPDYLAAADIVFVPFPDTVASHGISPLKLFEALAMEKPVIASSISGIEEVVCENPNVILVSNDPNCWVSAIYDVMKKDGYTPVKDAFKKYDFNYLAKVFARVIEG